MTSFFFLFPLIRNYVYNKLLCTALNHVIQMSCLGARASYWSDLSSYRMKNSGPNGILKMISNLFSAHI